MQLAPQALTELSTALTINVILIKLDLQRIENMLHLIYAVGVLLLFCFNAILCFFYAVNMLSFYNYSIILIIFFN